MILVMFILVCLVADVGLSVAVSGSTYIILHIDGLEQERRNSIANELELCLSCTNPTICGLAWEYPHAITVCGPGFLVCVGQVL